MAEVVVAVWCGGQACWTLPGSHNLENALAALSSAVHAGVDIEVALEALSKFKGVKRRLEKRGVFNGVTLYDDFAHHPTAIKATIRALRSQKAERRIVVVMEPRSNSMKMGVHQDSLLKAFDEADRVFVLASENLKWSPASVLRPVGEKLSVAWNVEDMLGELLEELQRGDHVIMMSNGSFQGLPRRLQQALENHEPESAST